MHVDLWSPGSTEIEGKKGYLLNLVCDLTQFTVSSVTYDTTALQLSQIFMSDVVILTFGRVSLSSVQNSKAHLSSLFSEDAVSNLVDSRLTMQQS